MIPDSTGRANQCVRCWLVVLARLENRGLPVQNSIKSFYDYHRIVPLLIGWL
jgi:hypothetical protein